MGPQRLSLRPCRDDLLAAGVAFLVYAANKIRDRPRCVTEVASDAGGEVDVRALGASPIAQGASGERKTMHNCG